MTSIVTIIFFVAYIKKYEIKIKNIIENNKIAPLQENKKLLGKVLSDFYISTSHNSYLNFIQHLSTSSTHQIKQVLSMGARAIELDISYRNSVPVIAHGNKYIITTTYILLEDAIKIILENGFNTSDPLIIFLEILNVDNHEMNIKVKNMFVQNFKDRLITYNSKSKNINVGNIKLKLLLNKLLLVGTLDNKNVFYDLFDNLYLENIDSDNKKALTNTRQSKQLYRIYPSESLSSILSLNIDINKYTDLGKNMVAMNFQTYDEYLYDHVILFMNCSFVLIN